MTDFECNICKALNHRDMVTFVDWELSHVGYQACDVGTMLQTFTTLDMQLPDAAERKYLRYYLEKWFEIQGKKESDVTDDDVDQLEKQANIFRLSTQLMWVTAMTLLFSVNRPDYMTDEDVQKLKDALNTDTDENSKDDTTDQDMGAQMVSGIYKSYLSMKDEILSNSKKP